MLTFDPIAHKYFYEGRELPSVTTVLKETGFIDVDWFTEQSRTRGQHVHELTQYHDEGDLDESTVADEYRGYFDSYLLFLKQCKPTWTGIENRIYDLTWGYAGTLDRIGTMLGKETILDIKTGPPMAFHPIQLAAYKYSMNDFAKKKLFGLYLSKDGTYKLKEYCGREEIKIFRSALNTYKAIKKV